MDAWGALGQGSPVGLSGSCARSQALLCCHRASSAFPVAPCPTQPRPGHPGLTPPAAVLPCTPPGYKLCSGAGPPVVVPTTTPARILPCVPGPAQGLPPAPRTMGSVGSLPGSPPNLASPHPQPRGLKGVHHQRGSCRSSREVDGGLALGLGPGGLTPQRTELGPGRHEGKSACPGPPSGAQVLSRQKLLGHEGTKSSQHLPKPKAQKPRRPAALVCPFHLLQRNAPSPSNASPVKNQGTPDVPSFKLEMLVSTAPKCQGSERLFNWARTHSRRGRSPRSHPESRISTGPYTPPSPPPPPQGCVPTHPTLPSNGGHILSRAGRELGDAPKPLCKQLGTLKPKAGVYPRSPSEWVAGADPSQAPWQSFPLPRPLPQPPSDGPSPWTLPPPPKAPSAPRHAPLRDTGGRVGSGCSQPGGHCSSGRSLALCSWQNIVALQPMPARVEFHGPAELPGRTAWPSLIPRLLGARTQLLSQGPSVLKGQPVSIFKAFLRKPGLLAEAGGPTHGMTQPPTG